MDAQHFISVQRLDTTLKLESHLLEQGLITEEQATDARHTARVTRCPVQDVLVAMGAVTDDVICEALSAVLEVPPVTIDSESVSQAVIELVPYNLAEKYGLLPLEVDADNAVVVAMCNPIDILALDDLSMFTNRQVRPVLARKSEVMETIQKCYFMDNSLYAMMKHVVGDAHFEVLADPVDDTEVAELKVQSELAPVVKLSSLIVSDAVKMGASDIHIEPQARYVQLRYRLDGLLKNVMQIPKSFQDSLISRFKILSNMDIAERRRPQDGRAKVAISGRTVDLRFSVLPTYFGEKLVIRLLIQDDARTNLSAVGFYPEELQIWESVLAQPQGMLLVTGPTGSGKTSTLYASLERIKNETRNIVTVEDPIEYQIEGLNQVQINPLADLTFASGLRSILRQDPDVVLVGEIRDLETAEIALQAAMTGHLVLSTLHTNDAAAAITRLVDLGIPPFLISSCLLAVVGQRLVRRICPHCQESYTPDETLIDMYRAFFTTEDMEFHRGVGCDECNFTGYRGRTAIFEILCVTDKVRPLIKSDANEQDIAEAGRQDGMRPLAAAAVRKVEDGITTLEECARVAYRTDDTLQLCPGCHSRIQKGFTVCPFCRHVVTLRCGGCGQELNAEWSVCPYCNHDLQISENRAAASAPAGQRPDTSAGEILLVHMDPAAAGNLADALAPLGLPTICAESLDEARSYLKHQAPILLVVYAPKGAEAAFVLCQEVRARVDTSLLPVMLFTEEALTEAERDRFREVGADDYLTGPLDPEALCNRAEFLLGLRNRIRFPVSGNGRRHAGGSLVAAGVANADTMQDEAEPVYGRLRMVAGGAPGLLVDLRGTRVTIGRSPNNDVQLVGSNVSRFHVQIVREKGETHIRDAQSRNGMRVNGKRVRQHVLQDGDEIALGDVRLAYESLPETQPDSRVSTKVRVTRPGR